MLDHFITDHMAIRHGSHQEAKVYIVDLEIYKVWKPHVISSVI